MGARDAEGIVGEAPGDLVDAERTDHQEAQVEVLEHREGLSVGVDAGTQAHGAGKADAHGGDGRLARRDPVTEEAKQAPPRRRHGLDGEQAEGEAAAVLRGQAEEERLEEGVVAPVRHGRAILRRCASVRRARARRW